MFKTALLSTVLLLGSTALYAKPPHAQGQGNDKEKHAQKHDFKRHAPQFSRAEQNTVRSYYDNLPPGLAKKYRRTGTLPPGWEQKVRPGQILPPEYLKIAVPLPPELRESLDPGPVGSTVIRLHDRILRIHEKSHEILDSFMLHTRL
jgi:hypothetical protein